MRDPKLSLAAQRMKRSREARAERFRTGKPNSGDVATMVAAGNQRREIPVITLPYVSIQHVDGEP